MDFGILKKSKGSFLDSEENPSLEEADVALLGVALDLTASYSKGTFHGPKAIIDASYQIEFEAPIFGKSLAKLVKIHNEGIIEFPSKLAEGKIPQSMDEMAEVVRKFSGNAINRKKFLVLFGGEHSVSGGAFEAMDEIHGAGNVTIVQFDAHLDLRKAYDGLERSHASAMRNAIDSGFKLVQIGIRDHIGLEEAEFIKEKELAKAIYYCPTMPAQAYFDLRKDLEKKEWIIEENIFQNCNPSEKQAEKICSQISTPFAYLSIDVDVIDSSQMNGTGTPMPRGLGLKACEELLYRIIMHCKSKKIQILGFDIVETKPLMHPELEEYDSLNAVSTASEQSASLLAYKLLVWNFIERFKE